MKVQSFGESDIGLVRLNNEDVWAQMPKEKFFILADGMGGHQAGEVAANEIVVHLCQFVKNLYQRHSHLSEDKLIHEVEQAIRRANSNIFDLSSQEKEMEGMGTTLCLALLNNEHLIYAHVGDSRIYRVRKGRLTQLTEDHSLKKELIEKGELDESLASTFPLKNVITRAIGTQPQVAPEVESCLAEPGDIYFLCSDGLSDPLSDEKILSLIQSSTSIKEAVNELIESAKKQGGEDNITIVMFKILS